jgi:hypothetical protein
LQIKRYFSFNYLKAFKFLVGYAPEVLMPELVAKDVHTERIFVTSELARRWLRLNIENNRPLNQQNIYDYARDMKNGKWKENGDTIKFADTGELIDGQHRLQACATAGVGFWSLVAYGVKREAFITIDRGSTRSRGQVLHMALGLNDYNAISATISWLWRFRDGIMLAAKMPTADETAELLEKHPKIRESVARARKVLTKFKAGPLAVVAVCHYLFSRQDADLAELFFDAMETGVNLRVLDPVYQLRERLIGAISGSGRKIGSHELVALYFKAWLATREQRTLKQSLRWSAAETFPNIGPIDGTLHAEKPIKLVKKGK